MKIVIDIPEKYLNSNIIDVTLFPGADNTITDVNVENEYAEFQVLPKGHGRLIDADDLIQDITDDAQLCIFNSESERIVHDEMVNFAVDRLADCSTIIEADKSEVE